MIRRSVERVDHVTTAARRGDWWVCAHFFILSRQAWHGPFTTTFASRHL